MGTAALRIVIPGGAGQLGPHSDALFVRPRGLRDGASAQSTSHRDGGPPAGSKKDSVSRRTLPWDAENLGEWREALEGADVLINRTGRSVNCRYTRENRREILESRLRSTQTLGKAIGGLVHPPKVWMNPSTATIYRHTFDRPMEEATGEIGGREADAPASWRFSIAVAMQWEESFFGAITPRTRKVALRGGIVMSPTAGGAYWQSVRVLDSRFGFRESRGLSNCA